MKAAEIGIGGARNRSPYPDLPFYADRHHPLQFPPLLTLTHGQRERHVMAQGRRARTRGARYRQRVGSGGCSGVRRRTAATAPPPPPHPASASISNNPAASGTMVDCHRLTPGWFRRLMAHAIAARTKASINRPLRPGDRGGTGGRGRERGALTEGGGGSNGDGDIGCRTPRRYRVRRNRAGGLGGSPGAGKGHRPGQSPFTAHT